LRTLEGSKAFSRIEVQGERRSDRPGESGEIVLVLQARYSAS